MFKYLEVLRGTYELSTCFTVVWQQCRYTSARNTTKRKRKLLGTLAHVRSFDPLYFYNKRSKGAAAGRDQRRSWLFSAKKVLYFGCSVPTKPSRNRCRGAFSYILGRAIGVFWLLKLELFSSYHSINSRDESCSFLLRCSSSNLS